MSLNDLIKSDSYSVFMSANDFAVQVQYTPQGGSPRTINGLLGEVYHAEFHDGNATIKYNKRTLEISAADDVNGVTVPKVKGRDGVGDVAVIDGTTYYVVDIVQEGKSSATWTHILMLSDKMIGVTRKG